AGGRADVAVHLVLLHGLFPGMRYSINGVWWTLTVEVLFYLLVALLAGVLRSVRGGWFVAGALTVTALAWRHLAWSPDTVTTGYRMQQLPGVADLFAAGMALALAERTRWFRDLLARAWARALLLGGTAVALPVVLWTYHANQPTYYRNTHLLLVWPLALGLATAGLILCIRTWGAASDRIARASGLAFLGTISYGIYLLHPLVIGAYGPAWFQRNPAPPVVPFVLYAMAGSVLTATGLHLLVERPGMAWARRLTSPARPDHPAPRPEDTP
ncbi:MAG: acyltransferase, partial [Actinobacteria bacterium]|nr:acyltransferase [Actinomycetota bacterium]